MSNEPFITRRGDSWILERELVVDACGYVLVVPQWATSDLASVPRFLWSVCAPFELGLAAPFVHDYLYRHAGRIECMVVSNGFGLRARDLTDNSRYSAYYAVHVFGREQVDKIFLDLMEQEGVSWWRRQSAYRAVRMFGGKAWQG